VASDTAPHSELDNRPQTKTAAAIWSPTCRNLESHLPLWASANMPELLHVYLKVQEDPREQSWGNKSYLAYFLVCFLTL